MSTNKKNSITIRIILTLVFLVISYLSFHFASWEFVWNEKLSFGEIYLINESGIGEANDAFLLLRDAFAIQINGGYYGVANTGRFLNSPILAWILLFVSIGLVPIAFKTLFGFDDEE